MRRISVKNNKGFTLIELLVVIAIIGMLSSVVLASLNSARAKGRDARRMADVKQIMTAMAFYRDDHDTDSNKCPGGSGWHRSYNSTWTTLETALSPYIPKLAHDPRENSTAVIDSGSSGYNYMLHCWANGEYMIVFNIENPDTTTKMDAVDGYTYGSSFFDYGDDIVWGSGK